METMLNLAMVNSKGQVTIPKDIRTLLKLKTGDKVLFTGNPDGTVTIRNASIDAMRSLQDAFEGAAEEAGFQSEEDVNEMIRQLRAEKRASQ